MTYTIAYDTETTGLNYYDEAEMFMFSTGFIYGDEEVIGSMRVGDAGFDKHLDELFVDNDGKVLVMHNAKFDISMTKEYYRRHRGTVLDHHSLQIRDTQIMSHILRNDHHNYHRLKDLSYEYFGIAKDDETKVKQYISGGRNYSHVPRRYMDEYAKTDALRTILLHELFWPEIEANQSYKEIHDTEVELIKTTVDMEERGIMLNRKRCHGMVGRLYKSVKEDQNVLNNMAGRKLNLDNDNDIRFLLYDKLDMPVLHRTTKTRKPSTAKDVLFKLREEHGGEAIDRLLRWRSYNSGITTMRQYMNLADCNDVLHPSINTCAAVTGRQSCSDPNLQNVAKSKSMLTPFPVPAREVFQPRPGGCLIFIDYAGIEMRLLVDASGEQELIDVMRNGGDVHIPACEVFFEEAFANASPEEKDIMRGAGKNANFAVPYGANYTKMSKTLGLPSGLGQKRFGNYLRRFPKLTSLTKIISKDVDRDGYVETAFGRTLHVPRDRAYMGTNYQIQGGAAGILKRAQNRVHKILREETAGEVQLILPIHDEIVMECPLARLDDFRGLMPKIREVMIDFPQFKVPLEIDVSISYRDWANKEAFTW